MLSGETSVSGKFSVRVEAFFEAAHNLRSYHGTPEPLHGHSYKVEAELASVGGGVDGEAIAVDFVRAKEELETLAHRLDYGYLNEIDPFTLLNPSAENIARWFFDQLSATLASQNAQVRSIVVWEGRFNSVTYSAEEQR
jgi:6-pyruvoyltetrahydropterin/6-carboxytetrahydropterin synthase